MTISMVHAKNIIEAAVLSAQEPVSLDALQRLFTEDELDTVKISDVIAEIQQDCESRGIQLQEVASGFRFHVKPEFSPWLGRLIEERQSRYSRALLETLALIAYRQPISRSEIEEVRGVVVSSSIIRTLLDREWVQIIGHRDVPGRPALYGTTKAFLDYFNLKSLSELPLLTEISSDTDVAQITEQLLSEPLDVETDQLSLDFIKTESAVAELEPA